MLSFMVSSVVSAKLLGGGGAERIMVEGKPIFRMDVSKKRGGWMFEDNAGGLWSYKGRLYYCGANLISNPDNPSVTWMCVDSDQ